MIGRPLFGFHSRSELRCFKLLIGVSGVGPKAALAILSSNTPENLTMAIVTENEKALTAVPGIGKKIAQRVILELKDKLAKAEDEVNTYYAEVEKIADLKAKEELFKNRFEEEQKEWTKDGITLEERYNGKTPSGKQFWIGGNRGFTNRSWHCFTLYIDGVCIFTSGEFWRCYATIKKS